MLRNQPYKCYIGVVNQVAISSVRIVPLVRSTDVRSIFSWSQSESAILSNKLDVRSSRLYGQLSLDKTLTLQAGSSVPATLLSAEIFHIHIMGATQIKR